MPVPWLQAVSRNFEIQIICDVDSPARGIDRKLIAGNREVLIDFERIIKGDFIAVGHFDEVERFVIGACGFSSVAPDVNPAVGVGCRQGNAFAKWVFCGNFSGDARKYERDQCSQELLFSRVRGGVRYSFRSLKEARFLSLLFLLPKLKISSRKSVKLKISVWR